MTARRIRGYSREFPTALPNAKRIGLEGIPPGVLQAAKRRAKRERVSLRVVLLRFLVAYSEDAAVSSR